MKKLLLCWLFLLPAVGCLPIYKTGPIWGADAKNGGASRSRVDPKAIALAPRDAANAVMEEGGPLPPAPTFSVSATEVNEVNAHDIASRLNAEMQEDLNAEFPPYPVVTKMKRQ